VADPALLLSRLLSPSSDVKPIVYELLWGLCPECAGPVVVFRTLAVSLALCIVSSLFFSCQNIQRAISVQG